MTILLKNGKLIDYKTQTNDYFDIFIDNGIITKIDKNIENKADNIIDCSNLFIIPGMIDMHCHLREPGFEYKETIETGSGSAVKGGFTSICPMPNTKPTPDSALVLSQILDEAKKFFKDYPNHSWIEFDIDNQYVRNAENKNGVPFDFGKTKVFYKTNFLNSSKGE